MLRRVNLNLAGFTPAGLFALGKAVGAPQLSAAILPNSHGFRIGSRWGRITATAVRAALMLPRRIFAFTCLLLIAGASSAAAQWPAPMPQQSNPCQAFTPIRQEVEQTMAALKAANDRKAPREEFCQLFQKLSVSTGKIVKFFEQNKTTCGVPDEAIRHAKLDQAKSLSYRKQACATAPASTPSLSDVLGAPVLPDSSTNKSDLGTFNTMTGNPLTR
jgi:hypothetical protein